MSNLPPKLSSEPRDASGDDEMDGASEAHPTHPSLSMSSELPFLVTHWLANGYQAGDEESDRAEEAEQSAARERIRKAAAELASAFSVLGAFGTTRSPVSVDAAQF